MKGCAKLLEELRDWEEMREELLDKSDHNEEMLGRSILSKLNECEDIKGKVGGVSVVYGGCYACLDVSVFLSNYEDVSKYEELIEGKVREMLEIEESNLFINVGGYIPKEKEDE